MSRQSRSRQSPRRTYAVIAGALALVALVAVAAVALAQGTTAPIVGSASNAKLGASVAVNARGRTLYALSPETSAHLLCKSAECLSTWAPLTVRSRTVKLKAGAGVQGRLGLVRRGKSFQVTLRGMPLYRFAGDHGADESNGEGIKSFGGTWHAVTAQSGATPKPPQPSATEPPPPSTSTPETTPSTPTYPSYPTTSTTTPTPTTTTPTTPTYTYPAY